MIRKLLIFGALACALGSGGCTALMSDVASAATYTSSSLPSQATTLDEASLAADLVVKATKTAVDTGKLDLGTLQELQALRAGVRAAMNDLVAANAAGQSLSFAAFNAALDAYRAYTTKEGIAT